MEEKLISVKEFSSRSKVQKSQLYISIKLGLLKFKKTTKGGLNTRELIMIPESELRRLNYEK